MIKVILDTNFCMIPLQFGVDVFEELNRVMSQEYEMVFPNLALPELLKLKQGEAALELLKQKGVKIVEVERIKNVDNSILEYAKKEKAIIATQDMDLKRKAKDAGLPTITMRQKKHLVFG